MIAMVAISSALVLSYALIRTQTTVLQISQNGSRRDLALQAAQTGAAVALEGMHSPDWLGVDQMLTRGLPSDPDGAVSYSVTFERLAADNDGTLPEDSALYVEIRSAGIWQSTQDENNTVQRNVQVVVRLVPRLSGRTVHPGDSATANDRAPNPGDYDQIQQYALYAGRSRTSLVLNPTGRIDGKLWLDHNLRLFHDPYWNSSIHLVMLESIGARYATGSDLRYPHPLTGTVTFYRYPSGRSQIDLQRLAVDWEEADSFLEYPAISFSDWSRYRLYEGGFEYGAVEVNSTLSTRPRTTPCFWVVGGWCSSIGGRCRGG